MTTKTTRADMFNVLVRLHTSPLHTNTHSYTRMLVAPHWHHAGKDLRAPSLRCVPTCLGAVHGANGELGRVRLLAAAVALGPRGAPVELATAPNSFHDHRGIARWALELRCTGFRHFSAPVGL
eukprot:14754629-Alexandrium_andersonii.AAC.1